MRPLPESVKDLLDDLEDLFPPRCIEPQERPDDAHRYAGKVELVADLRRRYEWTQNNLRIETKGLL